MRLIGVASAGKPSDDSSIARLPCETAMARGSADAAPGSRASINATDKRFFWLALYAQPVLWVILAIVALASFEPIWLTLVGELHPLP